MPGHITRRRYSNGTVRWRARHPDPLKGGAAQIERTFNTKREAEDWLDSLKHSAKSGTYIDPGAAARTLAAVVDEWRATWADLEPKTKAGYESILHRHVLPRFGRARLDALRPDAVQKFVNELAAERAPNTVRRVYTVLRSVLALAVQRRYIATNPADAVRLPKKGKRTIRINPLTHEQARALVAAVPEHYRVAVLTAAYTGLRAGELWALRREDVDLLRGELVVDEALKDINTSSAALTATEKGLLFGPTKTHATRTVSLPGFLRHELTEHLSRPLPGGAGPRALVFTTPSGTPVRHGLFYARVFRLALRAAGLPATRFHDLRHTCAAWLIAQGAHPLAIKQQLGHEDIRTTMNIYGHLFPSGLAALAEALDAGYRAAESQNVAALRS